MGSDNDRERWDKEPQPGPEPEVVQAQPEKPGELGKQSWGSVLKRTGKEFMDDELPDRAAALTYYGVLSIFPALLVVVSILGAVGPSATNALLNNVGSLAPGAVQDVLRKSITELQHGSSSTGSLLAAFGLLGAVWSASGYVSAFIRTSNKVYDLPEGRPAWKTTPLRVGLTLALMILLAASAVIVVFTGPVARRAGDTIGLGDSALTAWNIAKWPVLVLLVVLMITLLYWAAPNVRGRGFRWVAPGGLLAVVLWLVVSVGFALYVAFFGSYNKTYGTLAGVIVFLVWLWLTNLAILLGLEFNAEMARQRAVVGGHPEEEEPYVEPRDTRKWPRRRPRRRAKGPRRGSHVSP
jgi:membrane protein